MPGRVLLVSYTRGGEEALATSALRLAEVYGAERLIIVGSDESELEKGAGLVEELLGKLKLGVRVEALPVPRPGPLGSADGGRPAETLRRVLRGLAGEGWEAILCPSPGSRRLAAHLGMAAGGLAASLSTGPLEAGKPAGPPGTPPRLVYVDFCFGPWTGLYYPLTPRACTPILEVPLTGAEQPPGSLSRRLPREPPSGLLEGLPPLRRAVAELAYRVNASIGCSAAMVEGDPPPGGGASLRVRFRLRLPGGVNVDGGFRVEDVCSPEGWGEALPEARRLLDRVEEALAALEGRGPGGQLAALAGLRGLAVDGVGLLEAARGREVVADTSLVYRGLHVYTHAGLRVAIPQCLLAEVNRGLAEALKNRPGSVGRALASILAYAALRDMLASDNVSIAPSPSGPCDTSIPEMPPLLLEGRLLATADTGAHRYWEMHTVASRLAEPRLARSLDSLAETRRWASYTLLQAVAVLAAAAETVERAVEHAEARLEVEVEDPKLGRARLPPPRLGLHG